MARRRSISDETLLVAARAEFAVRGADASTRAIAKRAGVSEAVLFQRFKTKAGLFFAAMAPRPPDVERIFASAEREENPERVLVAIAGGVFDYFRSMLEVALPLMSHPDFEPTALAVGNGRTPDRVLHESLARYLRTKGAGKPMSAREASAAAMVIVAALHSLAFYERIGLHEPRDAALAIRRMVSVLWRGLAPRSGR
jgi:AcrR family transcriptional regulator